MTDNIKLYLLYAWRIFYWGLIVVAVAFVFLQIYIIDSSKNFIYADPDYVPRAKHALILGASVYGNKMSEILEDRAQTALELYKKERVEKILISGDSGDKYYDEVNAVKEFLAKKGVPSQDIILDHSGFDTYNSMYRAKDIFTVGSVVIITQNFHLSRAIFIARSLGMEAYGLVADRHRYKDGNYYELREWFARVKALYNVVFHTLPSYKLNETAKSSGK